MSETPVYLSTPRAMYDQLHRTLGKDTVLLFRVGDFYRAFWADAHRLADACAFGMSTADIGNEANVPTCGFPVTHDGYAHYVAWATGQGLRVAVVEPDEEVTP